MAHPFFQVPPVWRLLRGGNRFLIGLVALLSLALIAVTAVVVVAVAGGGGSATHPVGATVSDSWFTFRVTGVQTRKRVTGVGGATTAKGTFVLVSLNATNHDDKPWTIFTDDQRLRTPGNTYDVDTRATMDLGEGPEPGLQKNVNPSETVPITVAYDLPTGTTAQAIELHGAHGSHGVTVALPTR